MDERGRRRGRWQGGRRMGRGGGRRGGVWRVEGVEYEGEGVGWRGAGGEPDCRGTLCSGQ